MQPFWYERDQEFVDAPCGHGRLWLARDGVWRCETCEPPYWGEVIEVAQKPEQLSLLDHPDGVAA